MTKEIRLRACQEKARDAIVDDIINHLSDSDNTERRYGLIAPTGAGKTLILSKAIKEVAAKLNDKVAFIWLTPGKGDLANQSRDKVQQHLNLTSIGKNVYSIEDTHSIQGNLAGSVMVIGWEALNKKDKEGNPINTYMKSGDKPSFPDLCQATRDANIPIVLIIDEAHLGAFTEKSLIIRNEHINPLYTLEATATPKEGSWHSFHRMEYKTVAKSGLIKNDVRRHTFLTSHDGIRAGVQKLQELIKLAQKTDVAYNPRLLLFIPNAGRDNGAELDEALSILKDEFSWTEENGDVVVWMSDRKSANYEICKDNTSNTKVIITKEAIDTGVDIPAIQVIVQLRPIGSVQVQVQKLGRGLRMPEQKHYGNDLDKLYFYVFNDNILDFAGADYLKEFLERKNSFIKPSFAKDAAAFPKIKISYYERKSALQEADDSTFNDAFGPIFEMKLAEHSGFDMSITYSEECKEGSIDLDKKSIIKDNFHRVELEEDQTDGLYGGRMKTSLKHMYKHLECIEDYIGTYLLSQRSDNSVTQQQIFTLNNWSELDRIIFDSLREAEEKFGVSKISITEDYVIPTEYCIDGDIDTQHNKFLHDKYFVTRGGRTPIEKSFEEYLEKSAKVKWWLKNYDGQRGKSFSVCYSTDSGEEKTFFPDYVIGSIDDKFLIVDTKRGTIDQNESKKRDALVVALAKHNNVDGGIVKQERGHFYLQGKSGKPVALSTIL
jgi:type III restriction enzyme